MMKHVKQNARLPLILGIAQMLIAALLIWQSQVWNVAMMKRVRGTFGPGPWFIVCTSIDFPVAMLRGLWDRATFFGGISYVDYGLLVFATGVLWWWVGLNIVSLREQRSPFVPRSLPLRICMDLLFVAVGLFLGWYVFRCDLNLVLRSDWVFVFRYYFPSTAEGLLLFALQTSLHSAWAIAILFVFGRDLTHIGRTLLDRRLV
jgi:hypothetical protein